MLGRCLFLYSSLMLIDLAAFRTFGNSCVCSDCSDIVFKYGSNSADEGISAQSILEHFVMQISYTVVRVTKENGLVCSADIQKIEEVPDGTPDLLDAFDGRDRQFLLDLIEQTDSVYGLHRSETAGLTSRDRKLVISTIDGEKYIHRFDRSGEVYLPHVKADIGLDDYYNMEAAHGK